MNYAMLVFILVIGCSLSATRNPFMPLSTQHHHAHIVPVRGLLVRATMQHHGAMCALVQHERGTQLVRVGDTINDRVVAAIKDGTVTFADECSAVCVNE